MYRHKLCLSLSRQFDLSYEEQIALLRQIGFEGFFVNWEADLDFAALRAKADELGMVFQSVHAPFTKMADMWEESDQTQNAVDELLTCLRDCARIAVPVMVVHAIIGFDKHEPTALGLETFGRVVAEAEKLGVKLAFENTEGEEYLAALMQHFAQSPAVGFCWDTGHEMCYNYGKDMLALYGDRLLATHLNDNLGIRDYDGHIIWHDDLHLLPFDGIADWKNITARLKKYGFEELLTFELNTRPKPNRRENDAYARMEIEEYLTHAYMRACRVAALL